MNIFDFAPYIKKYDNEVGIEIEVEGDRLPAAPLGWVSKDEDSLRGEGTEYVLREPCHRNNVKKMLDRITKAYEKKASVINHTTRVSVHVHINVQDLTVTEIFNFINLFLIMEVPLVRFCGEHRQGNLFCQRSVDAGAIYSFLNDAASKDEFHILDTDRLRYAAINIRSLFKFGTLEFRSMEGTDDMTKVLKWVRILLKLKDAARQFNTPKDIISGFSKMKPQGFVKWVLGVYAPVVLDFPNWKDALSYQMRHLQMGAFTGSWKELSEDRNPVVVEEDEDAGDEDELDGDDWMEDIINLNKVKAQPQLRPILDDELLERIEKAREKHQEFRENMRHLMGGGELE